MFRIARVVAVFVCVLSLLSTIRAEEKAKAEDLFPDSTLAALIIPDLAATRAAAGKTRLAEMYAQPEMQAFLAPALGEIKKTYANLRQKNALLPAPEDIDAGLFGSEIAACIYARPGDQQQPAGVVVTLAPNDPEAFKRLLPPQLRQLLVEGLEMTLGPNQRDGSLAYTNGRIIVCVPQSDIQAIVARVNNAAGRSSALSATPGFKAVRSKLAQSALLLYAAPAKSIETALTMPGAQMAANPVLLQALFKTVGLLNVNGFGAGIGFSSTDPVCESFISFAAPPKDDLFALVSSQTPITAEALKVASPDAPFVAGSYLNFSGIIPFAQALVSADPAEAKQFELLQNMGRQVLGFDLQKDLLENLGSEIITAQTAVDTGVPLSFTPGLVISIPAKDPAKIDACLQKLSDAFNRAMEQASQQTHEPKELLNLVLGRMVTLEYKGKKIFYLNGQSLGSKLALTIVGNRLLVCTSYNAAKRGIEQLEANSDILSNKAFQDAIARISGKAFDPKALPASFAYSIDRGSGTGTLLLTTLGLSGGMAAVAGLAEVPAVPGKNGGPADISKNESAAIDACKAYAEAQEIYHRTDYTGNGVLKYAQSLQGDNSLLEQKAGAGDLALIDKKMGEAEGEPGPKASRRGYRFKILKSQGSHASGGQRDYVAGGNMTKGYALIAYPAEYGVTGKQSFMINGDGVVFGKDLGPGTPDAVQKITQFDPDNSWTEAKDEGVPAALAAAPARGNEFQQFLARPSGKAVMAIANSIDLGLWPDEGFFIKYRQPKAAIATTGADGIYWKTELPPPGPSTALGLNPLVITSGVAVVAAIAVPSLLRSRMAANETAAAAACRAYAEAQEIYHRTDYTGNGVLKYAPSLRDLYETKPGTGNLALIDRTFFNAEQPSDKAVPKAGYYFKVLKAQGAHATGGQRSYVVGGNMTLGYALLAYPAQYDSTGRDSFIINNNGTIFQRDLGPDTANIASKMTEFDPDDSWIPTQ